MTTGQGNEEAQTPANPGISFCMWPKAFINAARTVLDNVFEEEALNEEYRSYVQLEDVHVTKIVKPAFNIAIRPRKLTLMLDNTSVTVRGQIRDQHGEENFEKRMSGEIDVRINVVWSDPHYDPIYRAKVKEANLRFTYSAQGNGNNSTTIITGDVPNSLNDFVYQTQGNNSRKRSGGGMVINGSNIFMGNVNCVSNNYSSCVINGVSITSCCRNGRKDVTIKYSSSGTDDDDAGTLFGALTEAVFERLNHRLPDYSFPIGSSCDWMFNFSVLSKPEFQNGYLESTHEAAIYNNGDTVMLPAQAAPFPEPQYSSRMLTIFISNYVINTIGYCFHQQGILNYNLKQGDLIPQPTTANSTADDTSVGNRFLSDCFPEFSVKYPGASVEVNMAASEAPTATFSGQNLKVTLLGSAIFRARLANGSLVDFLTTEVNVETTVLLKLKLGEMTGTVSSILPRSITVVESALESVNREVLKEAFDLIKTQFLSRKFEEITQKGIPLPCPLLSGVEAFENVEMSSAEDFLRIDADLKFNA